MKLLILFAACCALALCDDELKINCKNKRESDVKETDECNVTEYQSYVECIRRRMKRSVDCNKSENCSDCEESSCQQCDCEFCEINICDSSCESCCSNKPPCQNNRCCHKACHGRCKSLNCRSECRKACIEKITAGSSSNTTIEVGKPKVNVTTIIDLHNIINTTNEIQIPLQINNTNLNNFTLGNSENPTQTHSGAINIEPCCQILSARQCVPKPEHPFVRCFHLRKKACGNICQAPVMLEQPHETCEQTQNGTKCQQQIIYVPQSQSGCNFQPFWPYINCGSQQYYNPYGSLPTLPYYGQGYSQVPVYQGNFLYPYSYGAILPGYQPSYNPYAGYPNVGYPAFQPFGYQLNNQNNVAPTPNDSNSYVNKKEIAPNPLPNPEYQYQYQYQPQPIPPWQIQFPVQMTPLGYPYQTPVPVYYLPPEVNIQATVSHPGKIGRYAQITIADKNDTETNSLYPESIS